MTETADDILTLLPARLREARRARNLSLEAVANLSGVSRSMVSQIERGESSPTISTLWNLTRALGVDFAGLLDSNPVTDRIEVLRADAAPTIDNRGQGCRIMILSPPEDAGQQELYTLIFAPGGRLASQPHGRGTREQLTVTQGSVTVISGAARADLSEGDTARYPADVPHEIIADGQEARALLVVKNTENSAL